MTTTAPAPAKPTTNPGALSNEKIFALLSNSRTKGDYDIALDEFLASDDAVVNVREAWPLKFANKTATSMYQSFNAKTKSTVISVKKVNDDVFLLHNDRVQLIIDASRA